MLASSRWRMLERLDDSDLVLDVGGWASPFERADWVIDLQPYATRGRYDYDRGAAHERFSERTWVRRDVCDHDPWPFADGQFDFAVCAQTLEDVRDPVWVCRELCRVARAGYVEVPSRLEEQSLGVHGPWIGWSHHRWLCDVSDGRIEFVAKPHLLHARASDHCPAGFHATLTPEERVAQLWWEGSFEYGERVFFEAAELDAYLADFVAAHRPGPPGRGPLRRLLGRA
ncbi:MAG: class I SAM-dependent methyltransferase [Actinobacteria bacterium]|nr:MAG: class I SAM-dependent methyltransferase [Actinomycetota bacterium]